MLHLSKKLSKLNNFFSGVFFDSGCFSGQLKLDLTSFSIFSFVISVHYQDYIQSLVVITSFFPFNYILNMALNLLYNDFLILSLL